MIFYLFFFSSFFRVLCFCLPAFSQFCSGLHSELLPEAQLSNQYQFVFVNVVFVSLFLSGLLSVFVCLVLWLRMQANVCECSMMRCRHLTSARTKCWAPFICHASFCLVFPLFVSLPPSPAAPCGGVLDLFLAFAGLIQGGEEGQWWGE